MADKTATGAPSNLRRVNRSNKHHEAQPLGSAGLDGRWTDEGLPLGLRRRLLRKEIEEVRGELRKEGAAACDQPAGLRNQASRERAN